MRQRLSESDVADDLFGPADSDIFERLMKGISDLTISELSFFSSSQSLACWKHWLPINAGAALLGLVAPKGDG